MILVDTSVWIAFFRTPGHPLAGRLSALEVAMHDHVLGEIALGSLRNRDTVLADLANLPRAPLASEAEVRMMTEARKLHSRGIGYTDAHLLSSLLLDPGLGLWTLDARLGEVAREIGIRPVET